jgi:hypothetical protein
MVTIPPLVLVLEPIPFGNAVTNSVRLLRVIVKALLVNDWPE